MACRRYLFIAILALLILFIAILSPGISVDAPVPPPAPDAGSDSGVSGGEGRDSGSAGEKDDSEPVREPRWEPELLATPGSLFPGDFTLLSVGPCPPGSGARLETEIPVILSLPYRQGEHIYFILGIGFQVKPGSYDLLAILEDPENGVRLEAPGRLEVAAPNFESVSFSVSEERTSSWPAQQLADDRARVRRARLHTEPRPLWTQPFILPLEARISSAYGAIRIINQGPPSHHSGIDYPAVTGTPVKATNDGVVRLSASLLAYGNIVILDHGMNLSSSYLHLDATAVREGETVTRGQVIGTVGDTGFSTGPHLHWEVNIGLTPVNPLQLVKGDLNYLPVLMD